MNWTLSDFIIAGTLITVTGILITLTLRKIKHKGYRLLVIGIMLAAFLLTWAELAVGLFGTPFAGS